MTSNPELYQADFEIMAVAVRQWCLHYKVNPDDRIATHHAYAAAIRFYCAGHRTASMLSSLLINEIDANQSLQYSSALH
jgi:tagatose-1,6-bisphosphate aldolase non-catalytic subunit AgaZ/GatZ